MELQARIEHLNSQIISSNRSSSETTTAAGRGYGNIGVVGDARTASGRRRLSGISFLAATVHRHQVQAPPFRTFSESKQVKVEAGDLAHETAGFDALRQHLASLQSELTVTRQEMAKQTSTLRAELERKNQECIALAESVHTLERGKRDLTATRADLEDELDETKRQSAGKDAALQEQRKAIESRDSELVNLREQQAKNTAQMLQLESACALLKKDNEAFFMRASTAEAALRQEQAVGQGLRSALAESEEAAQEARRSAEDCRIAAQQGIDHLRAEHSSAIQDLEQKLRESERLLDAKSAEFLQASLKFSEGKGVPQHQKASDDSPPGHLQVQKQMQMRSAEATYDSTPAKLQEAHSIIEKQAQTILQLQHDIARWVKVSR